MRTVVLRHWRGDQELLVSMYDDGSVTVASREEGVPGRTWGPPSSEVLLDEGEVPTFGIVYSFGLMPEMWTFPTEAKAQEAGGSRWTAGSRRGTTCAPGTRTAVAGRARSGPPTPRHPRRALRVVVRHRLGRP